MNSLDEMERDEWVKENMTSVALSPELKVAIAMTMTLAYNAGFKAGKKRRQADLAEQEREDRYGPMFF